MMRHATSDDGFTLIEAVIAILVMSIAVVGLFAALTNMYQVLQSHRGQAVAETAARSFGQAVQATAQSSTKLAAPAGAGAAALTVLDASSLPRAGAASYLSVGREVMLLDGDPTQNADGSWSVPVERGQGGSSVSAHTTSTAVLPLLRCPSSGADSILAPQAAAFQSTPGVEATIAEIEYWRSSSRTFVNQQACEDDFDELCPGSTLLPECSAGLYRLRITISTSGDDRFDDISAETRILVRSGSA